MMLHTLYLGLITRDNTAVTPRIRRTALDDTATTFGGYTAAVTEGAYLDAHGFTVTEPSLRIEVLTDKPYATVRAWAERLRILANQESVLLTSRDINAEYIGLTAPIVAHEETTNAVH